MSSVGRDESARKRAKVAIGDDAKQEAPGLFIRSFPHVEGNWPSLIFIKVESTKKLEKIALAAFQHCTECLSSLFQFTLERQFHISLSRPFVLRQHQISPFIALLHKALASVKMPRDLHVYTEYTLLRNDDQTRLFLCIPIEDRMNILADMSQSVSSVAREFRQPAYHEDAKFHISIASCPMFGADAAAMETSLNCLLSNCGSIVSIPRTFTKVTANKRYDSCDEVSGPVATHRTGRPVETGKVGENSLSDNDEKDDSSSDEVDEVGCDDENDCFAILRLRGIYCKFGNQLYRYCAERFVDESASALL